MSDIQIGKLVNRRHELRKQYTNTPAGRTEKRKAIQTVRNKIRMQIKKRQRQMKTERIQTIATYTEEHKQNRVMYECANMMMPKQNANFNLIDETGQRQMRTTMNLRLVSDHYEKQFNRETDEELSKWRGTPRPLENPLSRQEIVEAEKNLRTTKKRDQMTYKENYTNMGEMNS